MVDVLNILMLQKFLENYRVKFQSKQLMDSTQKIFRIITDEN